MRQRVIPPEHQDRWPLPLSLGDGGVWSSTDDIQRWNDALLPEGALDDRVKALIGTPGRLDDGQPIDYAWGFRVIMTALLGSRPVPLCALHPVP